MLAVLYWPAPNAKPAGTSAGSRPARVVAVLVWIVASAAFAFYVGNFGSYNKTYGTLGGVIVFLVWMWITNLAVLFGAELNAETERGARARGRRARARTRRSRRPIAARRRTRPRLSLPVRTRR